MGEIVRVQREKKEPVTFTSPEGKHYQIANDGRFGGMFKVGDLVEYGGQIYTVKDFPYNDRLGISIVDHAVPAGKREYNVPLMQCRHVVEVK